MEPAKPKSNLRHRLETLVAVVLIFGFLLFGCFGLAAIFAGPYLNAQLSYWFDRNPGYDGIELSVSYDKVKRINISHDPQLPANFYILVNGSARHVKDLTEQDFLDLGFEPIPTSPGTFTHGPPTVRWDYVQMKPDGLDFMFICRDLLQFSATKEGPFLTLPVAYDTFKEQFGKPTRSIRHTRNWRDPR